jgi:hypothetical protein
VDGQYPFAIILGNTDFANTDHFPKYVTVLYNLVDSCLHIGFGDPLHQITTRRGQVIFFQAGGFKVFTGD